MAVTETAPSANYYNIDADRQVIDVVLQETYGSEVIVSDVYYLSSYRRLPESIKKAGGKLLVVTCKLDDGRRKRLEFDESSDMPNEEKDQFGERPVAVAIMRRIADCENPRERFKDL